MAIYHIMAELWDMSTETFKINISCKPNVWQLMVMLNVKCQSHFARFSIRLFMNSQQNRDIKPANYQLKEKEYIGWIGFG